jgi:hypothetical protein
MNANRTDFPWLIQTKLHPQRLQALTKNIYIYIYIYK